MDKESGLSNKPDMQAIRFDENGNPVAWVFVEVKCTKSAYSGNSGLLKHLEKMRKYLSNEENFTRRKREAFLLLGQYEQLGLIKLKKELEWSDYDNLKKEILLVFTDDAIRYWKKDKNLRFKELSNKQKKPFGEEIEVTNEMKAVLVVEMKE